jgi:hypothetical protein
VPAFADLEVDLHRRSADAYAVELRFTPPDGQGGQEAEAWVQSDALVHFDVAGLRLLGVDNAAYGTALAKSLFRDPAVGMVFGKARSAAQVKDTPLRMRLFIDPSAPELHGLRWETLRDPQDGNLLFTGENILFSRYLSSNDWRPVRLRPASDLTAMVLIANPANLTEYRPEGRQLAAVDVPGELARAKTGLSGIPITALASGGSATLSNLTDQLRKGYDILYMVCHGAVIDGEPRVWLENEAGDAAVVAGADMVVRLKELDQRPGLVVLASCQSGTRADGVSGDEGALAALGPRLAEAGIPAVLAMQGDVSMETVAGFMPVFFRELLRDGLIDRATAAARGAIRDRADSWMPVLFMRLKSGRIWYVPGFGDDSRAFERWPALGQSIEDAQCTPILGAGLTESLLGSSREIAKRWADTYHFPMAPQDRDDLPQVAQFLAVNYGRKFPRGELRNYLCGEVVRRYGDWLSPELRDAVAKRAATPDLLDELVGVVGAKRRERDPEEPHKILAQLPFPVYITATAYNLLESALAEAGKSPQVEFCRWNQDLAKRPSIFDDKGKDYEPDVQHPLVYHLFGHLREPGSVVLTEDDYFDYLIGVTTNKDQIPPIVRRHLVDTSLLFLGFHMDDWKFRVLLRMIISLLGGSAKLADYTHAAVQIDLENEGRSLEEPERARRFLEDYLGGDHISIYWGSAEDFIKDLKTRSQTAGAV